MSRKKIPGGLILLRVIRHVRMFVVLVERGQRLVHQFTYQSQVAVLMGPTTSDTHVEVGEIKVPNDFDSGFRAG